MVKKDLAYQHWLKTHMYLYKGVEYTNAPHELEIDTSRGVIYLHNLMDGKTVLRVCRIPDDLIHLTNIGTITIDLIRTPSRHGHTPGKIIKKSPTFLNLSGAEKMMDLQTPEAGRFSINDESGMILVEFWSVPGRLLKDLWFGNFVDITLGYTK